MKTNTANESDTDKLQASEQAAKLIRESIDLCKHGEYEQGFTVIQQALRLAKTAENSSQIAHCFNVHGIIVRNWGQFTRAIEYFNKSLYLYEIYGTPKNVATLLGNLAVAYRNINDYSKSLEYFRQALAICENLEDQEVVANTYGNLGNLYRNLEEYDQALEFYKRSLEIGERTGDMSNIERQLGNIGNVYSNLKDFNLALEYQYRALRISQEMGNKSGIMIHIGNIGNIFLDVGRYYEALEKYAEAIAVSQEMGKIDAVAEWLERCGYIYNQLNFEGFNQKTAERYFLESLAILQGLGESASELQLRKSLAALYKSQGRWQEFAIHFEQFYELERKVRGAESQKAAHQFTFDRELEVTAREQAILEQKNAELEEANRFKTKLLGMAAHDLKNPLSNIISCSKVVLSELPDEHPHHEWLRIIESSASRMSSLISELLESSAASLGAMELMLHLFNVGEMVHHVCALNSTAAKNKNQQFDLHIGEDILVEGDQRKLYQVVDNIVSNAIKYSPRDAKIHVEVTANATQVLLRVKDEGQGLSAGDLKKLFGQFQKLSSVPTAGESSTGLGLHIAKHIIDLHKGKIWAESEGKGKGTTFFVELPTEYDVVP